MDEAASRAQTFKILRSLAEASVNDKDAERLLREGMIKLQSTKAVASSRVLLSIGDDELKQRLWDEEMRRNTDYIAAINRYDVADANDGGSAAAADAGDGVGDATPSPRSKALKRPAQLARAKSAGRPLRTATHPPREAEAAETEGGGGAAAGVVTRPLPARSQDDSFVSPRRSASAIHTAGLPAAARYAAEAASNALLTADALEALAKRAQARASALASGLGLMGYSDVGAKAPQGAREGEEGASPAAGEAEDGDASCEDLSSRTAKDAPLSGTSHGTLQPVPLQPMPSAATSDAAAAPPPMVMDKKVVATHGLTNALRDAMKLIQSESPPTSAFVSTSASPSPADLEALEVRKLAEYEQRIMARRAERERAKADELQEQERAREAVEAQKLAEYEQKLAES
jgi:hypothetical protein